MMLRLYHYTPRIIAEASGLRNEKTRLIGDVGPYKQADASDLVVNRSDEQCGHLLPLYRQSDAP